MSYSIRDIFLAYDARRHMSDKAICMELRKLCVAAKRETVDKELKSICSGVIEMIGAGRYGDALYAIREGYNFDYINESTKEFVKNLDSTTV